MKDLVSFLKTARHLWGRCPSCGTPFRLSDAGISSNPEPPRDWLRRLERQAAGLEEQQGKIELREDVVSEREEQWREDDCDLRHRERRVEQDSQARVRQILNNRPEWRALVRAERKSAVQGSRATLLGKLLER